MCYDPEMHPHTSCPFEDDDFTQPRDDTRSSDVYEVHEDPAPRDGAPTFAEVVRLAMAEGLTRREAILATAVTPEEAALADVITCTGQDDDGCAEAEGLGRCLTCGYITHDMPQRGDVGHEALCCGSGVDGCAEPFVIDGLTYLCEGHVLRLTKAVPS
jgi:hypothetical protein